MPLALQREAVALTTQHTHSSSSHNCMFHKTDFFSLLHFISLVENLPEMHYTLHLLKKYMCACMHISM